NRPRIAGHSESHTFPANSEQQWLAGFLVDFVKDNFESRSFERLQGIVIISHRNSSGDKQHRKLPGVLGYCVGEFVERIFADYAFGGITRLLQQRLEHLPV